MKETAKETAYDRLNLAAIEEDLINRQNQRFSIYELEGLPVYFQPSSLNQAVNFFNLEGKTDTIVEYFQISRLGDEYLSKRIKTETNGLIKQRLKYLEALNCKTVKRFFSVTNDPKSSHFPSVPVDSNYIESLIGSFGCDFRRMSSDEIIMLMYELVSMNDNLLISRDMTEREKVIQSQITWDSDYLKIGPYYIKVLSLRNFPDNSSPFALAVILDSLLYEYAFQLSFQFISQGKGLAALSMYKKLINILAKRSETNTDEMAEGQLSDSKELISLIYEQKHRFGFLNSHVVVWDKTRNGVQQISDWMVKKLKLAGYLYCEEYLYHDKEFWKALPGNTSASMRGDRCLAQHFIDSVPISKTFRGDYEGKYPLFVRNKYGELYGYDPFCPDRDNWNSLVLGGPGSGKSFSVNMLIANSMYPYVKEYGGRIFILDYKGPDKSSYKKMVEVFGGQFLPIDSSARISFNLFPPKDQAVKNGSFDPKVSSFLEVAMDLVLSNRGEGQVQDITRFIVSRAIRAMYKESDQPTLQKLSDYIEDEDKERCDLIRKLLKGFLDSPESRLVTKTTVEYGDSPFVVYDLMGVSSLTPKIRELMNFLIIEEARRSAFETSGYKFILFDEVAQLIQDPKMVALIGEMYRTARAFGSSIWTISQDYSAYKACPLSSVIALCSTVHVLLSHAADAKAKDLIINDLSLNPNEADVFSRLGEMEPGTKYKKALLRSVYKTHMESEDIRLEASPLDYWIATSDNTDNEKLKKISEDRKCSIVEACKIAAEGGI